MFNNVYMYADSYSRHLFAHIALHSYTIAPFKNYSKSISYFNPLLLYVARSFATSLFWSMVSWRNLVCVARIRWRLFVKPWLESTNDIFIYVYLFFLYNYIIHTCIYI